MQFDISDRLACRQQLEASLEKDGPYYGVVSNAGITRDTAFPAMTDDDWDQVIHTNLDSFYNVVQPLIMPMVRAKQGGRIVAMSSVSGVMGNRGQVNYSASKAGLIGAAKALALELAKRRITVNCVAPGLIETDMVDQEIVKEAMKYIPAQRMGKPEEVASLVSYLFSEQAGYITRQVISVNGGMA
jgi:3-oxoacyl-[acyl-carrier protein] reductase